MNIKLCAAVPLLVFIVPLPAAADVYDNAPAEYGQSLTQRRILERNLRISRNRQNAQRGVDRGTAQENARRTCANRAAFARQHGADDPRLLRLNALCVQAGY